MARRHAEAHELEQANRTIKHIDHHLDEVARYFDAALYSPPKVDDNRGGSSTEQGDPTRIDILDARRDCMRDLVTWTNLVLTHVNDGTIKHGPASHDIAAVVAFLRRWTGHVVSQLPDEAEQIDHDLRRHATRLRDLAFGWTVKRYRIGDCPEQAPDGEGNPSEQACTGSLWASIRSQDRDLPEAVTCDDCADHYWSPFEWRTLGRRLNGGVDLIELSTR